MARRTQQICVRTRGDEIRLFLSAASTDTIEHLKREISAKTGIGPSHLRLFYDFAELKDSSSLASCSLSPDAEVELEVTDVVFIETTESTHIPLEVQFTQTIAQIKQKLAQQVGTSAEELRLVFAGKELADRRTLQQCNVNSGWTLHLLQPAQSLRRTTTDPNPSIAKAPVSAFLRQSTAIPPELNTPLPCNSVATPTSEPLPEEDKAVPSPSDPEDCQREEAIYEGFTEGMTADLGQLTFLEDLSEYSMTTDSIDTTERLPDGLKPIMGKRLAVEIEAKATVHSLKATVQARIGASVPIQTMIFEGWELEDTCTLADYGIRPECTVYAIIPPDSDPNLLRIGHFRTVSNTSYSKSNETPSAPPPATSGNLTIHIKPVTDDSFDLMARAFYTISSLKDKIATLKGFPAAQQELIYANKPLSDERHISDYGIQQGDWVHLLLKGAGGMTIFVQFCFNSLDSVVRKQLVKSGFAYRKVKPGISFSSKCRNPTCKAFGAYIVVNKGFGTFDMAVISGYLPCPVCQSLAEPSTNCRFFKASWVFRGQLEGGEIVTRKGQTEGGFYYTYRESSTVQWRYLRVTVSSISLTISRK